MRSQAYSFHESKPTDHAAEFAAIRRPEDVLNEDMAIGEKRALLAFWASDAHAVPDNPTLRQLDNGAIARVSEILGALHALDGIGRKPPVGASFDRRPSSGRRRNETRRHWLRYPWRDDDDDDPPPVPAFAGVPPRRGDGGMFAEPEHAVA
ncbi:MULTISPECIES: hypothetical protein [unclassified Mesorhizobium]|uniref:hypothetical protein n=1 Tax=unclassified Mesorhizobium TaxID=325217 RepID=UPI001CCAF47B|nr:MULTISPECIES: hypothetical protein [unclassified Mesorhizobium]MBZ9738267.1 hypothetical protein [Mesorhizobium sp. CO1-1-4]MBZ9800932.1 hypothetical protein [Mesorhizobium sp. ES1-6]MBZ9997932.1 hypothetical protein [Mesorhizobium sp. BH1-1-4]